MMRSVALRNKKHGDGTTIRGADTVNRYPQSVSTLTRFATSPFLPVTFTLLEAYVFSG